MIDALTKDSKGNIENAVSAYQPTGLEKEIVERVRDDIEAGDNNLNQPFEEFNGMSLIDRINEDQKNWLNYIPEPSDDPEEDWRWFGTRPITRNKIISTAAHLTRNLIAPSVFAQNDQDEEDRIASYICGDLLEYNIRRSDYEQAFVYGVISGLVNPVSYFEVKYEKSYMSAWQGDEKMDVEDDELSGFQYELRRPEEILFDNPYQFFLQKQGFVAKRQRVGYTEMAGKYGMHDNWDHVQEGVKSIFDTETGLFYDVEDDEDDGLVEEVVWMNRQEDIEIPFVNGIYMGNPNVNFNPFYHRTTKDKPKYPLVKFGAEPIDNMKFFAYKSLTAKMANDQELVDRQWQLAMDASFLATLNPTITVGAGKVDKSVYVPATVTDLPKDAKVYPLNNNFNPDAAFGALTQAERSINESSNDFQFAGQQNQLPGTAKQSLLLQFNAETNLGLIGRMIKFMVRDVGGLMLEDIIRYQTIGELEEIVGEVPRMKYRSFVLDKKINGKRKSHTIRFSDDYAGRKMGKKEQQREAMRLKTKAGDDREISIVNPGRFAALDMMVTVDAEQMFNKNTAFDRAFKLSVYDKALTNPLIMQDPEALNAVTRDFLFEPLVQGDTEKYLPEAVKDIVPEQLKQQPSARKPGSDATSRLVQSVAKEDAVM